MWNDDWTMNFLSVCSKKKSKMTKIPAMSFVTIKANKTNSYDKNLSIEEVIRFFVMKIVFQKFCYLVMKCLAFMSWNKKIYLFNYPFKTFIYNF